MTFHLIYPLDFEYIRLGKYRVPVSGGTSTNRPYPNRQSKTQDKHKNQTQ